MTNTAIDLNPSRDADVHVEYRVWVSLRGATSSSIGLLVELFAGGAWVISPGPFRRGESLHAVLMFPDGREVCCGATVAHTMTNRLSVRFLAMPRAYVDAFDYLLGPGEFSRHIPVVQELRPTAALA